MTSHSPNEPEFLPDLERHNMRCGIVHGAFFQMGTAFADPYAVVPLFLAGFTESRALIGLIVSLIQALTIIPQLAVSRQIRCNPLSARPIMLAGIWMRCGVWGIIALTILLVPHRLSLLLIVFVSLVALYSLGAGFAVLPFRRIISETISPLRRSTFLGARVIAGGMLAGLAGMAVKSVLGKETLSWPGNYGILFAFSFVSLAVAYIAMSCFRFPNALSSPSSQTLPPLREEVSKALKEYPVLKRLISVRLLSGGLPLALPFLTLYATKEIGIGLAWVGVFVAAQRMGAILSNFLWMPLGNRFGTRSVILSGLGAATVSLAVMIAVETPTTMAAAFVLTGSAMSAMVVGFGGYILELGTREIRPLLFALEGTLLMPLYFMPLLGGWLVDLCGYRMMIVPSVALVAMAWIAATSLCEPRRGDPACGPAIIQHNVPTKSP